MRPDINKNTAKKPANRLAAELNHPGLVHLADRINNKQPILIALQVGVNTTRLCGVARRNLSFLGPLHRKPAN